MAMEAAILVLKVIQSCHILGTNPNIAVDYLQLAPKSFEKELAKELLSSEVNAQCYRPASRSFSRLIPDRKECAG
jgi:hypothetical protein